MNNVACSLLSKGSDKEWFAFCRFYEYQERLMNAATMFYESLSELRLDLNDGKSKLRDINLMASYFTQFSDLLYKFFWLVLAYLELNRGNWKSAQRYLKSFNSHPKQFKQVLKLVTEVRRAIIQSISDESELQRVFIAILDSEIIKNFDKIREFRNRIIHEILYATAHIDDIHAKSVLILIEIQNTTRQIMKALSRMDEELASSSPRYLGLKRLKSINVVTL